MDNDSKPETPSVFTEDPSSTLVIHIDEHKEFVLAAPLASPISHSRAQPSDTSVTPPSFTLSTQPSVHFATTKANQDNKPDCGATSLALIEPNDPRPHARRPSDATGSNTEEGTAAGYPPTTTCPTCNTTISVKSVVETHNLPTPTHVGSISEIGKSESQMRDHQKSGKKLGGDAQTGSGGNKDTTKVQGGPSLFSRLCGVRVDSPSFIPRIRQSSIPKDDRVTLTSVMTMVPTLVATSVGAGWTPSQLGLPDPAQNDPPIPGRLVKLGRALRSTIHKYSPV